LACPAHHKAEELILQMLRRLMSSAGYEVEVMPAKTLAWDIVACARKEPPALVFIAAFPGGLAQARHLCIQLRKEFPQNQIIVGYWGRKANFDNTLARFRKAGAGYLTTSLLQSRERISSLTRLRAPVTSQQANALTVPVSSRAAETGVR
jgi:hypothetical protein